MNGVRLIIVASLIAASGCQSIQHRLPPKDTNSSGNGGGYYGGDLPPTEVPAHLDRIPNAVPILLPLSKTGNNPYVALGKQYVPLVSAQRYRKRGIASWYGKKFHGRRTSSGEPYDMFAMTAAHPVLPLPSFVRVTNLINDKTVIVKVNDRGPFLHNRIIDLSYAAAWKLGITATGTGSVEVELIDPRQYQITKAQVSPNIVTGLAGAESTNKINRPTVGNQSKAEYSLQIGVYTKLQNAIVQRQKLLQAGFSLVPAFDEQLINDGAPYRVIAGPFYGLKQVERARIAIQNLVGKPVILRKN